MAIEILNSLPIPGLYGGQALFLLWEKWQGEPVSPAMQWLVLRLSMIVIGMLLVQTILNDIARWLLK